MVEYSYAVFPFLLSASVGTLIGIAQGALESFVARAPERATSFENPAPQATSPVTQFQLGEIGMSIEAALAVSRDTIAALERHAVQGTPMSTEERIRARAAVAYATRLSTDATTALSRIAGATAFRRDQTIQRHHRDATMLSNHAHFNYETHLGLLGSFMMGNHPRALLL
ncbi:acyl-CoA dehydrogenase family protein [Streptomyces sp. NPDC048045]|uniref:acyl-CoA dehydrogenase family protein n=1 Tax=Streptomyces sp. NPDC048045 TaxID=3154710 RepID=UPI00343779DF